VTVKDHVDALNEHLLRTHAAGQSNVLIIDEAQNLSADVLEQLRLLTNLETNERKLLQIVLIGQPELRALLARPEMQQLAQRVIARYHLDALSEPETTHYVGHRLAVAGLAGEVPFDRGALRAIFRHSRGVPRRINLLADRALLGAYSKGSTRIDARVVDGAAREVFDTPLTGPPQRRPVLERAALVGLGLLGGAAVVAAVVLLGDRGGAAMAPVEAAAPPGAPAQFAAAAVPARVDPAPVATQDPAPTLAEPPKQTTQAEPFELATGFESLIGAEKAAWSDLAQAWSVALSSGDPCVAARRQQLQCFRSNRSTLALIRQLDRPGILTLRDAYNRAAFAMLAGLSDETATLMIDGVARSVPLLSLADYWRGEFATFWRVPTDYSGAIVDRSSGPTADWLAVQLATARGETRPLAGRFDDETLRGWIHAFQLTQGLPSDGIAGPLTLMQLNRAVGIDEPRLRAE
jgi:general secretion pathway protein A